MYDRLSRRSVLLSAGTSGVVALAGCGGNGDGNGADGDGGNGTDGGGDGGDVDVDDEAWDDVEEFYFEGQVQQWTGIEPADVIGDAENPTIVLIEGNEYDFRWVNGDGVTHNMEIRDENDEIVEGYQSDDVGEEGEEATIEGVVASEGMTTYICMYHEATQVGDIEIRTE